MKPKITVITPFLNGENFVDEYIEMLKNQTFRNWACFLIDDGSSDKSVYKIRKNISNDSRFFLIKGKYKKISKGPSEARNFGLKFVKTDLVAFCDIDDLWHNQKLEKQMIFHNTKNLDLSVTSYSRFKDKKIKSRNLVINPPKKITYKKLLRENSIPMLTVIIKTTYLKEGFPLVHHEDYAFWLNLFKNEKQIKAESLNDNLAFYRVHSNNLTKSKVKVIFWVIKVFKYHGLKGMNLYLNCFIWMTIKFFRILQQKIFYPLNKCIYPTIKSKKH